MQPMAQRVVCWNETLQRQLVEHRPLRIGLTHHRQHPPIPLMPNSGYFVSNLLGRLSSGDEAVHLAAMKESCIQEAGGFQVLADLLE